MLYDPSPSSAEDREVIAAADRRPAGVSEEKKHGGRSLRVCVKGDVITVQVMLVSLVACLLSNTCEVKLRR